MVSPRSDAPSDAPVGDGVADAAPTGWRERLFVSHEYFWLWVAQVNSAFGDWVGLFFGDKTRSSLVANTRIEWAGAEEHGGDAAVTFVGQKSWQALDVTFLGVTFKGIAQAHFSSNGDGCNKALDPRHGMVWAGFLEPCR